MALEGRQVRTRAQRLGRVLLLQPASGSRVKPHGRALCEPAPPRKFRICETWRGPRPPRWAGWPHTVPRPGGTLQLRWSTDAYKESEGRIGGHGGHRLGYLPRSRGAHLVCSLRSPAFRRSHRPEYVHLCPPSPPSQMLAKNHRFLPDVMPSLRSSRRLLITRPR